MTLRAQDGDQFGSDESSTADDDDLHDLPPPTMCVWRPLGRLRPSVPYATLSTGSFARVVLKASGIEGFHVVRCATRLVAASGSIAADHSSGSVASRCGSTRGPLAQTDGAALSSAAKRRRRPGSVADAELTLHFRAERNYPLGEHRLGRTLMPRLFVRPLLSAPS